MLGDARRSYQPKIPPFLHHPESVVFHPVEKPVVDPKIASLFPRSSDASVVQASFKSPAVQSAAVKIGVLFSGGPAPGGHNVIAGLFDTLKKMRDDNQLIGFLEGPGALISGSYREIEAEEVDHFRNQGGFHLLGSGRKKIETPQQYQDVLAVVQKLKLDGVVIIGGDDSNTNAANLAEYFLQNQLSTRVIGVPKTIDADIQNRYVPISFGFDTASKIYSEMIGNLAYDTLSSLKYYHFIKLMGRSASHVTLECALKTHPNIALITEEKKSFKQIIQELTNWVQERDSQKTPYGIVLVPEGLIELMPDLVLLSHAKPEELRDPFASTWHSLPERIQKQMLIEKDSHGNLNLSAIKTELLLIESIQKELAKRHFKGTFKPQSHFYGYEGRCGHPSNFDANYSYALGSTAALLVLNRLTGMMAYVKDLHTDPSEWKVGGVPFPPLLQLEERNGTIKPVIGKALVNPQSVPFKRLLQQRSNWLYHHAYQNPGPIQFEGPHSLTDSVPLILSCS